MNLIGAIGALNRPAQALKSSAKQESAAAEKAKPGDTAEVSGLGQIAPAPAELGLGEARAALAALKQDIASRPAAAMAAQANVRPQVAIVLAG